MLSEARKYNRGFLAALDRSKLKSGWALAYKGAHKRYHFGCTKNSLQQGAVCYKRGSIATSCPVYRRGCLVLRSIRESMSRMLRLLASSSLRSSRRGSSPKHGTWLSQHRFLGSDSKDGSSHISEDIKEAAKDTEIRKNPWAIKVIVTEKIKEAAKDTEIRKNPWAIKVIVTLTVTYMAMNGIPIIAESTVRHSIALLRAEDPIFRRSGASRLSLLASTDEKRKKIVNAGGVGALLGMLASASDDVTGLEAVKALAVLAKCDSAVKMMEKSGGVTMLETLSDSTSDSHILEEARILLQKLYDWNLSKGE